ncbi:MAG: hypothetical protein H8E64_08505 [Candidatus Marinimicrobia bacterium]|nr:hypothetical protein [Candidatus Neomarinimicrobiota bacterium]
MKNNFQNIFSLEKTFTLILLTGFIFSQNIQLIEKITPSTPPNFALEQLKYAISDKGYGLNVNNRMKAYTINILNVNNDEWNKPESYRIKRKNKDVLTVSGSDDIGLMYGIYELAEQIAMGPDSRTANWQNIEESFGEPALEIRADNPFLAVEGETGIAKWFYDEDYWKMYFNLLAKNRFNICDIHAMYRYQDTNFPNIFPFFLKYPFNDKASWESEDQAKNLTMLKRVIELGEERGVHVALMNYATDNPGISHGDEAELIEYTSWAVAELLKECPDLWMFGFRVGESGKSEEFFEKSYLDGIDQSGKENIRLYTRTWLAKFDDMAKIGMKYPDNFYIEIKYNGEQLGAPYNAIQGRWGSYSYERYLNYPRYWKVIWQVRGNGTHRLFPWMDPDFARQMVTNNPFGNSVGFTLEPITAYYPQTPSRIYKNSRDTEFMNYTPERYWAWYMVWGRMAYDPTISEDIFKWQFSTHYGDNNNAIFDALNEGSKIVPLIFRSHCLGSDHRQMAPEFETGNKNNYREELTGTYGIDSYSTAFNLDEQVSLNCKDFAIADLNGTVHGKKSPLDVSIELETMAKNVAKYVKNANPSQAKKEWKLLNNDLLALTELAMYYAEKNRAAVALQYFYQTNDFSQLVPAKEKVKVATKHWKALARIAEKQYKPILDPLRTGKAFTWTAQLPELKEDLRRVNELIRETQDLDELQVGFVPVKHVQAGQDLILTAGANPSAYDQVVLHYNVDGKATATIKTKRSEKWTYSATISSKDIHVDQKVTYWFSIQNRKGQALVRSERAFFIPSSDFSGPEFDKTQFSETINSNQSIVHVEVPILDASNIESVWVEWKLLPSDYKWGNTINMIKSGSVYSADIPLTQEGILYSFVAADAYGNTTRWPDEKIERPHFAVNPFDGGLEKAYRLNSKGRMVNGLTAKEIKWSDQNNLGRPGRFFTYKGKGGQTSFDFTVDEYADYHLDVFKVVDKSYSAATLLIDGKAVGNMSCQLDVGNPVPTHEIFTIKGLAKGKHTLTFMSADNNTIGLEGFNFYAIPATIDKFMISQSFDGYILENGANMYPIGNPNIEWRKAATVAKGIIRLDAQQNPREDCHSFAVTELVCDRDVTTTLRLGTNDGAYAWLNGELVFEKPGKRRFIFNQDTVEINLKKGVNTLVLLISQAGRNWLFNVNVDSYHCINHYPEK